MSDEMLRAACFASLDVLCAQFGDDVPYRGGLDRGFPHGGRRIPFLSPQKGIFRAAAQTGPAALSINTSSKSPYGDAEVEDGYLYAYRSGAVDQPDNRALRYAYTEQIPIVYFVATRPGWYRPLYPSYILDDDPTQQRVLVSPGRMIGPLDEPEPTPLENQIERRYAVRESRVRLHQAVFRGRVLRAYSSTCTICRLKEVRLLDAAHIAGDLEANGEPIVPNGLSLCSIHHPRSTSSSSASRPTTRCAYRRGCSRRRTARCSSCSRASTRSRSCCRRGRPGGPTASGWPSATSGSRRRDRSHRIDMSSW
jgi:putative restriction endonuclease